MAITTKQFDKMIATADTLEAKAKADLTQAAKLEQQRGQFLQWLVTQLESSNKHMLENINGMFA